MYAKYKIRLRLRRDQKNGVGDAVFKDKRKKIKDKCRLRLRRDHSWRMRRRFVPKVFSAFFANAEGKRETRRLWRKFYRVKIYRIDLKSLVKSCIITIEYG